MDILFKPRVEATEQMAQYLQGHFAIQESKKAQNHVQVTCTITVCSSFFLVSILFYARKPKLRELKRRIFFCLIFSISRECHKMYS